MYSLKHSDDDSENYETYGAVMLDSKDPRDSKAYVYTSFIMDGQQQLIKLLQAVPDRTNEFPEVMYHYAMLDKVYEDEEEDNEDFLRTKRPQYMFQIPQDDEEAFYMSGTYRGVGSVMKFYKRNGALRWHASMEKMTHVDAIAVRNPGTDGLFFGCGRNKYEDRGIVESERKRDSEAWFFAMDSVG